MANVTVYFNSEKVFFESISHEFYIVETPSKELFWSEKDNDLPTGTMKIWLQSIEYTPRILYVLPDWQLVIDGVRMEKKFYTELEDLKGKTIELIHKQYRFVFSID